MAEAVKLNMDEINGLIGRVEYAIAHDLSVSSEDLKLLLDLLLGANARLNRQKLNKTEPASSLRVTGQAPLKVTKHILEQLRCNTCGAYFTAELPEEVLKDGARGQQYGYSARALMAIYKNLTGVPYFRQQSLQQVLGMAVAASTIYDQCKAVADVLKPLVAYLVKLAADAPEYALDDTTNRILDQQNQHRSWWRMA